MLQLVNSDADAEGSRLVERRNVRRQSMQMRAKLHSGKWAVLLAAASSMPAFAVDTTFTAAGFTGLGVTPNAHLLNWGSAEAVYDNQLPGVVRNPSGHNYVLGFGLLPNLEVSARLAANENSSNCFVAPGCGTRDLSASGKVSIGLDPANHWRVAVGATDLGGSVTYFRSYYGVLTFDEGPLQASGGLAKRSGRGSSGSKAPISGPFVAAAVQPVSALRAHLEYSDGNAWTGVRVFAPAEWLPDGWAASVGANVRLTKNNLSERSWWTASLSIPLYKVSRSVRPAQDGPDASARPFAQSVPSTQVVPGATLVVPPPAAATAVATAPQLVPDAARLEALAAALQKNGFDGISLGYTPLGALAVRVNNAGYQWNVADAVGAALGVIAHELGNARLGYSLLVAQSQIPLVAVTGQVNCLREWLGGTPNQCTAGELTTPGVMALDAAHAGVNWVVRDFAPAWKKVRIEVSPVLRTTLGTEVGVLDYDLGARLGARLPLWSGAAADVAVIGSMARSSDFEAGRVFGQRRIRSGLETATFTQTMQLPMEQFVGPMLGSWQLTGLSGQVTVGRVGSFYDGALGSLRWEPGDGRQRLSGSAGIFRNNEYAGGFGPLGTLRRATPVFASYRYSFTRTRTDTELTGGRFMNNDSGIQLGLRQWFNDISVSAFYRRSSFPGQTTRKAIGVEFALPIGPRRDYQPSEHVQVGGTPRFTHRVETASGETGGNPLRTGAGVRPPVPGLDGVFNQDRSGLAYFEDNVPRIREVARQFVKE
jgi:hypothetical protein